METMTVKSTAHAELIDVTDRIQTLLGDSGIASGLAMIHVPHTTAAVTINENADPTVVHDILADLERVAPWRQSYYRHAEGNSAAHLKSSMIGCWQTVPIEKGRLVLGTWQGIYFCEFDGPRTRRMLVKLIADAPEG
ncbi:MAG: YjbQ family protein [Candidatus Eisenbacteria bacterium]|nr:YjbQ family protein [Candidatus Eisenbacteria bacterium]